MAFEHQADDRAVAVLDLGDAILGDQGLQEYGYKKIDDAKTVPFKDAVNGWLGITDKYWAAALLPFNIYRIIGGIGVGVASLLAPLYIAEIAPPSSRGWLVSFQQLAIVGGTGRAAPSSFTITSICVCWLNRAAYWRSVGTSPRVVSIVGCKSNVSVRE